MQYDLQHEKNIHRQQKLEWSLKQIFDLFSFLTWPSGSWLLFRTQALNQIINSWNNSQQFAQSQTKPSPENNFILNSKIKKKLKIPKYLINQSQNAGPLRSSGPTLPFLTIIPTHQRDTSNICVHVCIHVHIYIIYTHKLSPRLYLNLSSGWQRTHFAHLMVEHGEENLLYAFYVVALG